MQSGVGAAHADIGEELGDIFGGHRGAPIGEDGQVGATVGQGEPYVPNSGRAAPPALPSETSQHEEGAASRRSRPSAAVTAARTASTSDDPNSHCMAGTPAKYMSVLAGPPPRR
jgi:hypothetical protein